MQRNSVALQCLITGKLFTCRTLQDLPESFRSKFEISPDGCWNWTAATSGKVNYPQHRYGKFGSKWAHRFAWEVTNGPVPSGLETDHLCGNKLCVNPEHLELVTHQENCRRRKRSGPLPGFKFQLIDGKRRKL